MSNIVWYLSDQRSLTVEIWKLKISAKNKNITGWIKKKFWSKQILGTIDNFLHPSLPSLCTIVLEELEKDTGRRWIVFSEKEANEMFMTGRAYVDPERGTVNTIFLNCVLTPARESYLKEFSITYIREDDPNKSPLETGAPLRLAIQIGE